MARETSGFFLAFPCSTLVTQIQNNITELIINIATYVQCFCD